jgi:putative Holliday junction resolvase
MADEKQSSANARPVLLGVDLGERRVGLALHDDPDLDARPAGTLDLRGVSDPVVALAERAKSLGATEIVVGLPLNMNGTDGPAAKNARRTATALRRRVGLPVHLWDERLTTTQAQRSRTARGTKGREGIDAEAAAILLQAFVDARRGGSGWQASDD